jgi:hypothetical protein
VLLEKEYDRPIESLGPAPDPVAPLRGDFGKRPFFFLLFNYSKRDILLRRSLGTPRSGPRGSGGVPPENTSKVNTPELRGFLILKFSESGIPIGAPPRFVEMLMEPGVLFFCASCIHFLI